MDFQIAFSRTPVENGDFAAVCVINAFSELALCVEEIKQAKESSEMVPLLCRLQYRCQTFSENVALKMSFLEVNQRLKKRTSILLILPARSREAHDQAQLVYMKRKFMFDIAKVLRLRSITVLSI